MDIKFNGRLLVLDKPSKNGFKFSKDCQIDIPPKVPVYWNFDFYTIGVIGHATVKKDDIGLYCEGVLQEELPWDGKFYMGGYYKKVKRHKENELSIVDSCSLESVSILPDGFQADDDLIMNIVVEEKEPEYNLYF